MHLKNKLTYLNLVYPCQSLEEMKVHVENFPRVRNRPPHAGDTLMLYSDGFLLKNLPVTQECLIKNTKSKGGVVIPESA